MRRLRILALGFALALAGAGSAVAGHRGHPKLVGTVADPFVITLTKGGKKVTSLKAGTYRIVVKDTAADHDFHLTGPGVNKVTSVTGTGTVTWTVKLKKGTYTYMCDPHASFMKGSFTVK